MDLATDTLLHHIPPVELQTRVYRLYTQRGQVKHTQALYMDIESMAHTHTGKYTHSILYAYKQKHFSHKHFETF